MFSEVNIIDKIFSKVSQDHNKSHVSFFQAGPPLLYNDAHFLLHPAINNHFQKVTIVHCPILRRITLLINRILPQFGRYNIYGQAKSLACQISIITPRGDSDTGRGGNISGSDMQFEFCQWIVDMFSSFKFTLLAPTSIASIVILRISA